MNVLETEALTAGYGDFQALFGIDFAVAPGQVVAIIGANGAGKSTFLRAVTGMIAPRAGAVRLHGENVAGHAAEALVRRGVAMAPEGRKLFPSLSVEENLRLGGLVKRKGPWDLARVYALFPILGEKRRAPATSLSGGQQQMVCLGRALMSNPELLLCDEISLGLAPVVIRDLYSALPQIVAEGAAIVLVEQDLGQALAASEAVYCFQEGRVSLSGRPGDLSREAITAAYFGKAA